MNYYILSIDSLEEALSSMDSDKVFTISTTPDAYAEELKPLNKDDLVVVYRREPIKKVYSILKVTHNTEFMINVRKVVEIGTGIDVKWLNIDNIDDDTLIQITKNEYVDIYKKIIELLMSDNDDEKKNLREEFEFYLREIRKLSAWDRQAREIGNWSAKLLAKGEIDVDIYSVSDLDTYLILEDKIRNSEDYIAYKADRKEKNPNSGLPSDQGLSNYEEFIKYRYSKEKGLSKEKAKGGFNKIFYGAPGCGKSHYVSKMLKEAKVAEENIFRVTFHPEYMNCDFVGQVLPSVEEKIDSDTGEKKEVVTYAFNPGPFTLALERAYQTSDMVYLVIEEINRGNAAAIFGDLFQLLDRVKNIDDVRFSNSEYPIRNPGVQDYILKVGDIDVVIEAVKKSGIFIPGNLTILATMNSSDQNVFTLDTAFKRRWLFEQISNDITKDKDHKYKNWYVPGTDISWEVFMIKLNDEILNYKIQNQTNEDKRLGKYFVTQECLMENANTVDVGVAENFGYKVFEYIWNDVCKIGRDDWFDPEKFRTLEDLIEAFVHPENGENPLDVFKNIKFKD